MLSEIELTIIVTSYNRQEVILETLKSIELQSFKNWECIIVDDHSTDNTCEVVQKYIVGKSQFIFIRNERNSGVSFSRNIGLINAKASLVFFLDSDDLIASHCLEYNINYLKNNENVGVSYHSARYFENGSLNQLTSYGHNNIFIQFEISQFDNDILKTMYLRNPLVVGSAIYRKKEIEIIGLFDEALRLYEDWDLHIRLAKNGVLFNYLGYKNDGITYIRIHNISLMSQSRTNNNYYKLLLKKHPEILKFAYLNGGVLYRIKNFIPPIVYLVIKKVFSYV